MNPKITITDTSRKLSARRKVLRVTYEQIMRLITRWDMTCQTVMFPKIIVPEGTRALAVHNDPMTGGFAFILENPAWDEVPEGQQLPSFEYRWEVVEINPDKKQ